MGGKKSVRKGKQPKRKQGDQLFPLFHTRYRERKNGEEGSLTNILIAQALRDAGIGGYARKLGCG